MRFDRVNRGFTILMAIVAPTAISVAIWNLATNLGDAQAENRRLRASDTEQRVTIHDQGDTIRDNRTRIAQLEDCIRNPGCVTVPTTPPTTAAPRSRRTPTTAPTPTTTTRPSIVVPPTTTTTRPCKVAITGVCVR